MEINGEAFGSSMTWNVNLLGPVIAPQRFNIGLGDLYQARKKTITMTLWLAEMIKRIAGELVGPNVWELRALATTNIPI